MSAKTRSSWRVPKASFAPRKIDNQRAALLAFLKDLPAGSRIGMESTGSYHELLAELAHKLGFVVYVLNPKDTRHYAKAMGLRGKTDRVDAELIARMIAHEHEKLHPWIPPTAEQRQIDRLLKRRAKVSRIRATLTQSFKDVKGFAAELKALRNDWTSSSQRLDAKVKTLIEANTERKQDYARLRKIDRRGRRRRQQRAQHARESATPQRRCLRRLHRPGSAPR